MIDLSLHLTKVMRWSKVMDANLKFQFFLPPQPTKRNKQTNERKKDKQMNKPSSS